MLSAKEIAWLAGLIEGEGSFSDNRGSIRIQLAMTDADVVAKAAAIFGVLPRKPWQPKRPNSKLVYGCVVYGSRAIGWMQTLYQFLGERRQARIRDILSVWKTKNYTARPSRGVTAMAHCHPNRERQGLRDGVMLCRQCWMRSYRKATGKNGTYYRHKVAHA